MSIIVRKARPYSIIEELARRQPVVLMGVATFVARAEDAILSKLEWSKLGSSERQLQDAAGIVKTRGDALRRIRRTRPLWGGERFAAG